MMEMLKSFIMAWAAVFLQTSLVHYIGFKGMIPDLVAMAIAAKAIKDGPARGSVFGTFAGFLADCYHPATMGILTLSGSVGGWVIGTLRERIYKEQLASQAAMAILVALIRQPFEYLGQSGGSATSYPWFLWRWGLGSAIYTGLLSLLVVPGLISWLSRRPKSRLD